MPEPKSMIEAARELGISRSQLARDIRAGAPVARRGGRGRGRTTRIDVDAVAKWRKGKGAQLDVDALRLFAAVIPELVAEEIYEAFTKIDGPHKRECAGALAAVWYCVTTRLLDHA